MRVRLETSLHYSSIFLNGLSFSLPSPNASRIEKAINSAHFSLVVLGATSMYLQVFIYIIQNATDSLFVTEHVSVQVAFLQSLGRITMYRVNKDKFIRLSNGMNDMVKNGSQQLKNHLQGYADVGNVIYFAYMITIFILATDFCLMPLFKVERTLPIEAWYPFDYKESTLLYCVAYSHQICVIITSWFSSGIDVTFGYMVFNCCARCKMVQEMLEELNKLAVDQPRQDSGLKLHTKFDKTIAKLVNLHCQVFDSVKDINDIHTYIVFVLFLTSVIMICCAGYQITNVSEQSVNSKFIFSVMVCCLLSVLLLYFVPGEMLANEANAVGIAAYHTDWESMPPRNRRCILFIMARSAIPPKLQVARVMPLLLDNYSSFLATTASYFTSLQAVAGID